MNMKKMQQAQTRRALLAPCNLLGLVINSLAQAVCFFLGLILDVLSVLPGPVNRVCVQMWISEPLDSLAKSLMGTLD